MSAASQSIHPSVPVSTPSAHSKKKRIIICCDGTGNKFVAPNDDPQDPGSGCNSNVVKFYTALDVGSANGGETEQVAYYHPGVGTMGSPLATDAASRLWSQVRGLAFGYGFRDNVLDAYRYLMENYNDNGGGGNQDEVYILGFSRGAYTARALAGLLHGYGLLCRGNEGHLLYAWSMYVDQHDERNRRDIQPDEAFKLTFSHDGFKVRFMGVWDTVSSVGWIYTPLRLLNVSRNDTIQIVRHAISIDERRCFFMDNIWGEPAPETDLLQVWFAGVHSDIGGGYRQSTAGLANISLDWMLREAEAAGVRFQPVRRDLVLGVPHATEIYAPLLYQTPTGSLIGKSLKGLWRIAEVLPHLYYDKDLGQSMGHNPSSYSHHSAELYRIPLGAPRALPNGALIHGTAYQMFSDRAGNYRPPNLACGEIIPANRSALDGSPYYTFCVGKNKVPGLLQQFLQSKYIMIPLGAVEVFFLLGIIVYFVVLIAGLILTAATLAIAFVVAHCPFLVWLGKVVVFPFVWLFHLLIRLIHAF